MSGGLKRFTMTTVQYSAVNIHSYEDDKHCGRWSAVVPYYCAKNNKSLAFTDCLGDYQNIDVATLTAQTKEYELEGLIDSTGNMTNDRVFIFSGVNDTVVVPGHMTLLALLAYPEPSVHKLSLIHI